MSERANWREQDRGRTLTAALVVIAQLAACSSGPAQPTPAAAPKTSARVRSPTGWCEAYVVEWSEENAQVLLDFDRGACGGGAVSAFGKDPRLVLRWIDATTLEVRHSARVRMERGASGETVQCGGPHRRVRVLVDPE